MIKKTTVIVIFFIVSALAFYVYRYYQLPSNVTPMSGDDSVSVSWLALATSIVTLLIAIVGLIQKIIELRAVKK